MPNIDEFFKQQRKRTPYRLVRRPDHPLATSNGQVYEHVVVAETAVGHFLTDGVVIHHVDGDPRNNANRNLVICQDHAYHMLLHQRARVLRAGGNPNTQLLCGGCKVPQDMECFHWDDAAHTVRRRRCKECSRESVRRWQRIQKILIWAGQDVEF